MLVLAHNEINKVAARVTAVDARRDLAKRTGRR